MIPRSTIQEISLNLPQGLMHPQKCFKHSVSCIYAQQMSEKGMSLTNIMQFARTMFMEVQHAFLSLLGFPICSSFYSDAHRTNSSESNNREAETSAQIPPSRHTQVCALYHNHHHPNQYQAYLDLVQMLQNGILPHFQEMCEITTPTRYYLSYSWVSPTQFL